MGASDILAIVGALVTGLASFFVGRMNTTNDRQKFYEDKITSLLETQSKEIKDLKDEIERLTEENHKLNQQVMDLTIKLELRDKNGKI